MYVKNFQIHYYIITLLNVNSLIKIVYVDNVCMIIKINIYVYIICIICDRNFTLPSMYMYLCMYVCMYVLCVLSPYMYVRIFIYIYM